MRRFQAKIVLKVVLSMVILGAPALPSAVGGVLTVDGTDDIFNADNNSSLAGGSTAPVEYSLGFTAAPGTVLTFSSVTGSVSFNGGGNYNDPDGIGSASSEGINASGGISGISNSNAGFLVGVFLGASTPTGPAPASLSFGTSSGPGIIETDFASLSPLLGQTFFVGDGLTGDGAGDVQQFSVPTGATALYLGFADAGGYFGDPGSYGDNLGSFTATFTVTGVVPEPSSLLLLSAGCLGAGLMLGRRSRLFRLWR